MTVLGYNANDGAWRASSDIDAEYYEGRAARLVLVEPKALLRDCMKHLLQTFVAGATVECVSEAEEIDMGLAELLLVGLDPRFDCEPARLRSMFATMRRLSGGAPIAVVLHGDDVALARELTTLDVAGILLPSANMDIVIAAVRLMLVGGIFLPPEIFRQGDEGDEGDSQGFGFEAPPLKFDAPAHNLETPPRQAEASPPIDVASEEIHNLHSSEPSLTLREREVLKCLRAGRQNKIIAFELGISESTVKVHLRNIMKKLHTSNRTQAALYTDVALPYFEALSR